MEEVVDGSDDQGPDAVEVAYRRHAVGQALEGSLDVAALPKEHAVDHLLGPAVDRVQEQHDDEGEDESRHDGPGSDSKRREGDVEERDDPGIRQGHETGDDPIDRPRPDHRAQVEEVVPDHGVGHGEREQDIEPPEQVQVRNRDAEDRLRRRAEHGQELTHGEAQHEHPRPLAEQRSRSHEARPAERHDEQDQRRAPVHRREGGNEQEPVGRSGRYPAHEGRDDQRRQSVGSQTALGWRRTMPRRWGKVSARWMDTAGTSATAVRKSGENR